MRLLVIFCLLMLFSCGGSLSSEQRKKIRANMDAKSIKKISDVELTEAALNYGRTIGSAVALRDKTLSNKIFLDSLGKSFGVQIFSMHSGDLFHYDVERKIIEAYTSVSDLSGVADDLQKIGSDTLIYTKPLFTERPDGSLEFSQALGIRIPKKQVILSIKQ